MSSVSLTRLPATAAATSPAVRFDGCPGPPSLTAFARAPARGSSFMAAARSGVRFCTPTPSQGRCTLPVFRICSATRRARSDGTAKPMPLPRPTIIVLMPSTRPSRSQSGPPELPGLMLASVWR